MILTIGPVLAVIVVVVKLYKRNKLPINVFFCDADLPFPKGAKIEGDQNGNECYKLALILIAMTEKKKLG